MKGLSFFPTPYPDEIFYSVLCRHHFRGGIPSPRRTNLEIWGNIYGKKLHLPDGIANISAKIPQGTNLTAKRIIEENTIFPLMKPFLTAQKCDELIKAMVFGDENIYNIVGFLKVFTFQHRALRYCVKCMESDKELHGEPYWHRVHQLPGVYVCPLHGGATVESAALHDNLKFDFYPPTPVPDSPVPFYEQDIAEKLLAYAQDALWLLRNGAGLQCLGHTDGLYDNRLRVKGYRDRNGKTGIKKLSQDIIGYYGHEFLSLHDAYNSGTCLWVKRLAGHGCGFRHPLHHLLLMRFLSGSAEAFFTDALEKPPEYRPFGEPPYPCRNYLCGHHLQDVIARTELRRANATPHATFVCPHCGFSYARKGNVPKEKHYKGQIHITEYGWKWESTVSSLLAAGVSPYRIAGDAHCDVRTVISFGIKCGILPPERFMGRIPYAPTSPHEEKQGFGEKRALYRQRWLNAIAENPTITRSGLRFLDSKADQWLHLHDAEWLELHSPSSKKMLPSWMGQDDEYLERVENAVNRIRGSPGKPKRISLTVIGKAAGILKPHKKLTSEYLPNTKAFVLANIDTLERWRRRKILWAVSQLRMDGEILTVYKVRRYAAISSDERGLDEFILECISESE